MPVSYASPSAKSAEPIKSDFDLPLTDFEAVTLFESVTSTNNATAKTTASA